jgi:murein L,D-transpeptidase YcbB/YkuD
VGYSYLSLRSLLLALLFISTSILAETNWETESSRYLEQLLKINPDRLQELNEPVVADFYRQRQYRLLWSDDAGRKERAYDLLQVIIQAHDEGLEPSDYYLEAIRSYWNSVQLGDSVQLDLLLSAALYRYGNDAYTGRFDPGKVDIGWNIRNEPVDSSRLLLQVARLASIEQLLKQLAPTHAGYQRLKHQLRDYRELEQQGGWPRLPWGPVLERGVQHEQVRQLKRRLEVSGDLVDHPFPESDLFDRWLEKAVEHYQRRHGLEPDGKVGPQTRRSLNISVSDRIRQIRINLERWRWLQRDLGNRYLMVNMTGFELQVIDDETVVLSMPIIIGKTYRATPTFSGLVSYMEYNPYWTIPINLVFADIIPRQIDDPAYLERKSIKVYRGWTKPREVDPQSVDWRSLNKDRFPYWLRQEPGPKNALGRVKFIVSNPYEIYLHGTPDTHLFERVVRTFSSGCIRVKDPVALAAFLLNDGSQQKQEEVLANIHLGTNQGLFLPTAVPIYLVYWTAWVDQNGTLNFRKDIYNRDTLLNELFG